MKPTIAFILKGYPRVSETFIAQEIYLLEQRGFEIEILSMRKARESERQPIVAMIQAPVMYIPEYIGKDIAAFARENLRALLALRLRYLSGLLHAAVACVAHLDHSPMKRFLQAGWIVGKKEITKHASPYGHLHSHFIHSPTELAFYLSKMTGLRYSISAHAKDIYTIPKSTMRDRINASELFMTCTHFNFEFVRSLPGVDRSKVHKVYHGIDLKTFDRQSPMPSRSMSRFLSVGRLVEKKGYDTVFSALQILKSKGIQFHYDVYGAGELKDSLLQLRESLKLTDEITFHWTATHPSIIARMNQGGIFICGSKQTTDGDRDGIPNTVAEAMSMQLPVVATNISGIPELIEDNVSGLLVPSNDPHAMANAIEKLLSDPAYAIELGKAGRKKVEQVFDSTLWIEKCAQLLRRFQPKA